MKRFLELAVLARAVLVLLLACAGLFRAAGAGGGFLDGGLEGEYFATADLAGTPAFTRRDVRIDFDWGTLGRPGGSRSPGFAEVGPDAFSVRWSGRLSPRNSGLHTLVLTADDGARLFLRRSGAVSFTNWIDAWTSPGTHSVAVPLEEGARYDVRIEYRELSGPARVRLAWSSPAFPEETVDVASLAAINVETYADEIWANAMDGARDEWRDPGFGNDPALWPGRDADGWPLGDAGIIVWEGAEPASMAGMHRLRFRGRARVAAQGTAAEFYLGGSSLGHELPAGAGWDPASNTTTADVRVAPLDILFLFFRDTRRNPGDTTSTGVSEVALERPVSASGDVAQPAGSRFDLRARRAFSRHAALRWISNFETERTWSDRVRPFYSTQRDTGSRRHWERMVQLSNETGKDLYACIPHRADDDYVRRVARLIRFGSDGVDPYDAPQADPVFPPLNPNLRVYLERGNEIWNFSFSQGPENAEDGRREVLLGTTNGAVLNFDGSNPGGDSFYRWHALRSLQMSEVFRSVWGDAAMGERVRFLLEYQYDNFNATAETALDFLDRWFNNGDGQAHVPQPWPVNHFFWGGGGAAYFSSGNSQGVQTHTAVPDGGFELPVIPGGAPVASPSGSGWAFGGTAGYFGRRSTVPATSTVSLGTVLPGPETRRALGFRFTTGDEVLAVYELGKRIPHGPKRTHELWLLRASDRAVVAYAVTSVEAPLVDDVALARLATPAVLEPRTAYLLLCSEDPFGDGYFDSTTRIGGLHGLVVDGAAQALFGDPAWDPSRWTVTSEGGPGTTFGPLVIGISSSPAGPAGFAPDPPQGLQALWMAGTSSVSRVVDFARPGTYALRFQAAARADRETGVFFDVDGQNITPRAASHNGPVDEHWVPGIGFNRDYRRFENNGSFVFTVTNAGPRTLRITSTGYPRYFNPFDVQVDPDRAVYFDAVEIVGVDDIFAGGIPSGGEANGQPSELTGSHAAAVASQARYAQAYGLKVVAYEGGWSLGGDFGAVPIQNWAKFRDPRAARTAVDSMDLFARSGGALYTWGTYTTWPKGEMEAASGFPLTQGVDEQGSSLPPEPLNGVFVPARLVPSNARWGLNVNLQTGRIDGPGGWLAWNVLVPATADYEVVVATTNAGRARLILDGSTSGAEFNTGEGTVRTLHLVRGLHNIRIQSVDGTPAVASVSLLRTGSPGAPVSVTAEDGDGSVTLRWSPAAEGPTPDGFLVRVGTAPGSYSRELDAGTANSLIVRGLSNNVTHFFAVVARNGAGNGVASPEVAATPFADGDSAGLVVFEFTGLAGNEASAPARSVSSRVRASVISRGPGLVPTTYADVGRNTFGSEARGDRYGTNLTDSAGRGQRYQFTVAPGDGRRLSLERLRFRPYFQNVDGGPGDLRGAGVTFSTNGVDFTALPATGTPSFSGTGEFAVDLSGQPALRDSAETVTVRIHLFGNGPFEFTGLGGPGDDVVLTGRISAPAVVSRPDLSAVLDGGAFLLSYTPRSGGSDVLERSADLSAWSPVTTQVLPGGRVGFSEPVSVGGAFFRLRP